MFTIVADARLKLLRVRLAGFFSLEEVGSFAEAAQNAVADMGCSSGDWLHSCDISQMPLQAQSVTDAFDLFINHPNRRSQRLAIITGSSPVRMQIRRLLGRSDAALFKTIGEADEWLLSQVDQRAVFSQTFD